MKTAIYAAGKYGYERATFYHRMHGKWSEEAVRNYIFKRLDAQNIFAARAIYFRDGRAIAEINIIKP